MSSVGGAPKEMLIQSVATQNVASTSGVGIMAALRGDAPVRGSLRGETVENFVKDPAGADNNEEAGMHIASHKPVHLKEMEVKAGRGTNIEAIRRILDYLDNLPDLPQGDKLKQLVDKFEQFIELMSGGGGSGGGGSVTVDDILKALQDYDEDVTHQFVALDGVLKSLETTTNQADTSSARDPRLAGMAGVVSLLKEAQVSFARLDVARDVRAGFAAAAPANELAPTLEAKPAELRESYRAMLREQPARMGQIFRALSQYDLMKGFSQTISSLTAATTTDLESAHPSIDKTQLQVLVTELSRMRQLTSVYQGVRDSIRLVERLLTPADRGKLNAGTMMGAMLDFADRQTVSVADARKLLVEFADASPATQVHVSNAAHELHGQLPDAIFPSSAARLQQSAVLDAFLDEIGQAEEAVYATGTGG